MSQELRSILKVVIDDKRIPDLEFYDRAMDIMVNVASRLRWIDAIEIEKKKYQEKA
jgi:hypothetical protein